MLPLSTRPPVPWAAVAAATAPPFIPRSPSADAGRGPQSRSIQGRVGFQPAEVMARREDDGVRLDGIAAGLPLSVAVTGAASERRISGEVGGKRVDLTAEEHGGVTRLRGSVGDDDVGLEAAPFGDTQVNVFGHVGVDAVKLYVYRQIDGNVVDGFAGGRRVSFRDRDIQGRLQGLDPLDYVAVLVTGTRPAG